MSGLLPAPGGQPGQQRVLTADAAFPLQHRVRLSCRSGVHILMGSDSNCLLFSCFVFLYLVLYFNAYCNFFIIFLAFLRYGPQSCKVFKVYIVMI